MNTNKSYPWYLTWPAIIIAFILFWPVGIALIFFRTQKSKKGAFSTASDKKFYIIIGVILILIGLSSLSDSPSLALFMLIGGIALIVYSNALSKKAKRNKAYIDMIINNGETSIDKISSILNVKYDIALKELKTLQATGILKNITIDEQTHTITVQRPIQPQVIINQNIATSSQQTQQPIQVETSCPGCGAKYVGFTGNQCICEYCDSEFIFK